jgi:hypothetical protein
MLNKEEINQVCQQLGKKVLSCIKKERENNRNDSSGTE